MIRSGITILFDRRASHFTRYNQQDLVAKAARLNVVEKGGHRVIHLVSQCLHVNYGSGTTSAAAMKVPPGINHGYESASRFA